MVKDQINRITSALARIDAATAQLDIRSPAGTGCAELKARHAALRSETAAALADMDALVAKSQTSEVA